MLIDHAIARIRAYRRARGWSVLRFAAEAGMPESTIRGLDRADWSPSVATLRKLEAVIPAEFHAAPAAEAPASAAE